MHNVSCIMYHAWAVYGEGRWWSIWDYKNRPPIPPPPHRLRVLSSRCKWSCWLVGASVNGAPCVVGIFGIFGIFGIVSGPKYVGTKEGASERVSSKNFQWYSIQQFSSVATTVSQSSLWKQLLGLNMGFLYGGGHGRSSRFILLARIDRQYLHHPIGYEYCQVGANEVVDWLERRSTEPLVSSVSSVSWNGLG